MNTDNNARFQETEERIMQAYGALVQKKAASRITVSDICREAGIHRTTFYGHYCDILDLEENVEHDQLVRLINEFQIEDKWDTKKGLLAIAGFCRKYRGILKKQLKGLNGGVYYPLSNPEFMYSIEDKFKSCLKFSMEQDRSYYRLFCEAGIMAVLARWIEEDCRMSDEAITDIFCEILEKVAVN